MTNIIKHLIDSFAVGYLAGTGHFWAGLLDLPVNDPEISSDPQSPYNGLKPFVAPAPCGQTGCTGGTINCYPELCQDPLAALLAGQVITCFTCMCPSGTDVGRSFRYKDGVLLHLDSPEVDASTEIGWHRLSDGVTPEELIARWTGPRVENNHTWIIGNIA